MVPYKEMELYVPQTIKATAARATEPAIPQQVLGPHIKQDIVTSMYNKDDKEYKEQIFEARFCIIVLPFGKI